MANVGSNVVIKMEADASQVDVGMKRAARATKNYEKTTQKANQQLRFMRGGLGQVGHQVQDIAVQLQMGQNAMLVFGQQGSQIASLFGPGGAMIGALLAVAAAITGSLMPSLFGATEAQKELKEANNSLIDSFDDLRPAQQAYARVLANEKIREYKDELEKLNKVSRDRLTMVRTGAFGQVIGKKDLETLEEYNKRIKKLDSDTAFYKAALAALESQVDSTTTSFEKQDEKLRKQIDTFGLAGQALRDYGIMAELSAAKITHLEAAKLLAHSQTLGQLEENAKREEEIDKDANERNQSVARTTKLRDEFLAKSSTEKTMQMIGDAVALTQGIGKQSKKMAALQKTVQVGQAIMNTYTAASKAIATYGIPAGIPFAALAVAQGMAQVQAIRSASFEGGGFTGHGSRTGGVDGKGGFPAILHPNETVIDHTKTNTTTGSPGEVIVNQTINVTTGVQQTVRAEIANLMPQIAEAAQDAVLGAVMQGGGYSDSLRRG